MATLIKRPRPQLETGTGFQISWLLRMLVTYVSATLLLRQLLGNPGFNSIWRQQVPEQQHYNTTIVFGTAFLLDILAAMFYHDTSRLQVTLLPAWIKGMPFVSSLLMATGNAVLAQQAGTGKIVNLSRYICWMHTTPAVIYLVKSVSPAITTRHMVGIILLHEAQLGLGAVAKLSGGITEVVLGGLVHLALVPVLVFLHKGLTGLVDNYSRSLGRLVYVTTIVTYASFGVVWDLGLAGWLSPDQEEAAYLTAEFLSKILFSSVLMFSCFRSSDLRRLMVMRAVESAGKSRLIGELQRAVAQKDQFLASVSHELRTPLNGIIGMSEAAIHNSDTARQRLAAGPSQQPPQQAAQQPLVQQQVLLEAATMHQFQLIRSSGLRLLSLVNDILDATALQHDRLQLCRQRVVLRPLVEEVADITRPLLPAGLELITRVPSDLQVIGDQDRIVQVLNNLISNAVKFTDRGRITVTARLGLQDAAAAAAAAGVLPPGRLQQPAAQVEVVYVTVADTGRGIPADRLGDIFLPFEQVHTALSRSHRGLGLGLSITSQLLQAMGGSIEVASTEGRGSTFTICLQAYSPAAMALAGGPVTNACRRQRPSAGSAAASSKAAGVTRRGAARQRAARTATWEYSEHAEERRQQQQDWGASYSAGGSSDDESAADEPGTPNTFAQGTTTTASSSGGPGTGGSDSGQEEHQPEWEEAAGGEPGRSRLAAGPKGAADSAAAGQRVMGPRQAAMALGSAGLWGSSMNPAGLGSSAGAAAAAPPAPGPPQQEAAPAAPPPPAAAGQPQFFSVLNGGRRQVLVVDDDPISHQVLALLLGASGYELQHANSGPAALSWLASKIGAGVLPDLVLLDVSMPGMDGLEVCRRLRSMLASSGLYLPISMVTAQDSPSVTAAALAAGADDVLCKPYTRDQLLACVSRNLVKQQAE